MQDVYGDDRMPLTELVPAMARDARRKLLPLAAIACTIALLALAVGVSWPRKYFASTTLLVSEDNIIQQLMEGRAVATSVADRAVIARETIFSKRVMDAVLQSGGWLDDDPDPAERARRVDEIEARTVIGAPRENLLTIQYWDRDPQRAYAVTTQLADLFMAESRAAKLAESREAYEFIADQAAQYHEKVVAAEQQLQAFREVHRDARPGHAADVGARIVELRRQIETDRMRLMELRSGERALQAQLAGEQETFGVQSVGHQYGQRLAALQEERDRLLLNYTDEHPDVVRVRHQIDDLRSEMERAQKGAAGGAGGDPQLVQFNPVHQDLRGQLARSRRDGAAAQSRIAAAESLLDTELQRDYRIGESEAQLDELKRDHAVHRDIYQDLLKRRENARVSMSLDEAGRGLTFRVHEPAVVPARPSGIRLAHFAAGGLLAAAAVPIALLFVLMRLDPRVRSANELERVTGVPVLTSLPTYWNDADRMRLRRQALIAGALVFLTMAAYGAVGWLRLVQAP